MGEHLFNCDTRNPEEMDLPCNCEELKAKAALPTYRELMAERIGLERFKTAYMEWQDKTEWVQKTATAKELGRHRADVMADRIAELERECERLREEVSVLRSSEAHELGNIRAELEACRKDAERYRWLREGGFYALPYNDHGAGPEFEAFDELDSSIDAAMQEGGV